MILFLKSSVSTFSEMSMTLFNKVMLDRYILFFLSMMLIRLRLVSLMRKKIFSSLKFISKYRKNNINTTYLIKRIGQ